MKPAFTKNNTAIVMCASNYYAPYTSVVIQSILECRSEDNNYDLIVLSKDMTKLNQETLLSMVQDCDNVFLRFVDMSERVRNLSVFTTAHFTIESYFRIFIPYVLSEYEKVIYCDCDLVWLEDPAKLYEMDIEGNIFGAIVDPIYICNEKLFDTYWEKRNVEELHMPENDKYTNTGIMIWNIALFREVFSFEYVIQVAQERQLLFCDQDVLNILCGGHIFHLPANWNVLADTLDHRPQLNQLLGTENDYEQARSNPYVFHWADRIKPWGAEMVDKGYLFWNFAKNSPFYESILYRLSHAIYSFYVSNQGFCSDLKGLL